MSFLAPFLLVLSGFAALPVLLHLIRRKRVRILDFPTLRFLKQAAMEQRFHLRLQDQLLMILRMLVLLLAALAFAGPTTRADLPADVQALGIRNALIVDDSLSMAVRSEGKTVYDQALELARSCLSSDKGSWKVVFASDLARGGDPLANASTDLLSFSEAASRHPLPGYRGAMSDLVTRLRGALDPETRLFILSDRTSSNWKKWMERAPLSPPLVDVLAIGPSTVESNTVLSQLSLKNGPLFEKEPALLSVSYETFGQGGTAPTGIRYGWRNEMGAAESKTVGLSGVRGEQGTFESLVATPSSIESVSASLVFPQGVFDPLPQDDYLELHPRFLKGERLLVLAGEEEWRRLLQAALAGFDVTVADAAHPPAAQAASFSSYVVVLGREATEKQWWDLIRARVEAGAGLLVCYDQPPDGLRLEAWSEWWETWNARGHEDAVPAGPSVLQGGAQSWFAESLDPTARETRWTQGGFPVFVLDGWEEEWLVKPESADAMPLFETQRFGQGAAAVWTVPLSPQATPLVLSPGWVPLLSQMIKRTLIDPEDGNNLANHAGMLAESDLTPLSKEEESLLGSRGCRIWEGAGFVEKIGNLPTSRHDWTLTLLALCLALAVVEIGVSNYL
jgi:hypothetical protein